MTPDMPRMKIMGRKTTQVVMAPTAIGAATSFVPSIDALRGGTPPSCMR